MNGNAGQINYSTAKAGVVGMAKTMAKEWGRYNVNVNAVGFGLIKTRLTDADAEKEELMGTLQDTVSDLQKESDRLNNIKDKTTNKLVGN